MPQIQNVRRLLRYAQPQAQTLTQRVTGKNQIAGLYADTSPARLARHPRTRTRTATAATYLAAGPAESTTYSPPLRPPPPSHLFVPPPTLEKTRPAGLAHQPTYVHMLRLSSNSLDNTARNLQQEAVTVTHDKPGSLSVVAPTSPNSNRHPRPPPLSHAHTPRRPDPSHRAPSCFPKAALCEPAGRILVFIPSFRTPLPTFSFPPSAPNHHGL